MKLSDPVFTPQDFLDAEEVVDHLLQARAIQFQIEGDTYDRETMQKHVNERVALIGTKNLLLDEAQRVLKAG